MEIKGVLTLVVPTAGAPPINIQTLEHLLMALSPLLVCTVLTVGLVEFLLLVKACGVELTDWFYLKASVALLGAFSSHTISIGVSRSQYFVEDLPCSHISNVAIEVF